MKRIYSSLKCLLVGGLLLASQGCEIDLELDDRYTDLTVYKNPESIDLYMAGMYNEFHTFKFGQFPIGYDNATDGLTDIMKYTSSAEGNGTVNRLAFEPQRVSATSPNFNYWSAGFNRIRRINELMHGVNTYAEGLSAEQKTLYEAEARFIRGYVYFWLVKLHGSVVLLPQLTSESNNPRSSEEESWNFVLADFAFAAEHLPTKAEAGATWRGRATKDAAYSLLARAALYAGSIAEYDNKQFNSDPLTGIPSAKQGEFYQRAANAAAEVMKLGYSLPKDFTALFTTSNNAEAIFTVDYQRPGVTHTYDSRFSPPVAAASNRAEGVPTAELVEEFEMANGEKFSWSNPAHAAAPYANRDPRFYGTVLYNGAVWQGRTLETFVGGNVGFIEYGTDANPSNTVTGYYVRKYLDPTNTNFVQNKSAQSWMLIRYAEVLLIYAEAQTKLGNLPAAKNALNEVRGRANLPNTQAQTAAEMMKAIEHERIVELAFEGHRYWDLRRWRKAHIVLNNKRVHGDKITKNAAGNLQFERVDADKQDRRFLSQMYYIPLPQQEIANNKALRQIQGW
ncbi:RagB/SusD family nutrient uptake outer membrane protein [Rufibacter glacialis]|uniref:RagB/SusD family nutrient uptake outer membrane protein n=1 Tax=Rufibacter glacialis TaxID=1259555 RepID=A0A5M8QJI3_9BACT|nr:RagB/SusD family nutrient uptake outer membrane protein [Rufibacter glacialis]KAA6435321.1 RagB/SusD family nutrient uptake outer membrane protein [Rufibacter glacialis]GGK62319.1 hypothetical protein GCM10011405_08050 [Rufibacter glacialis]